jgi:hypothetical protein
MTTSLSLPGAAARLSAVAADLATALGNEETDPMAPLTHLDRAFDLLEVLSWGMCREPASFPLGGLREIARDLIAADGTSHRPACASGCGGMPGCAFADEVAGVVLGAVVLAEAAGIDLEAALIRKAAVLASRQPETTPVPGGSDA